LLVDSEKESGMEFVVAFIAAIWFLAVLLAFRSQEEIEDRPLNGPVDEAGQDFKKRSINNEK